MGPVAQGATPFLRETGRAIINISDVAAFDPWPEFLTHAISKAGVEMLTKGLARVLAPVEKGYTTGTTVIVDGGQLVRPRIAF